MKLFTSITFLTFLLSASSPALAGDRKGNGGDGVVCLDDNDDIASVQLFDFFEASYRHPHLEIDLGGDDLTYKEKIEFALERLSKMDPSRAQRYQDRWSMFEDNLARVRGVDLVDVPDTGNARIPEGCKILQLAVQEKPIFPTDSLYTFDQDLVDHMSEDDHAGLILHEILLGDGLDDQPDTTFVRYFNNVISSSAMNEMSYRDYLPAVLFFSNGNTIPFDINGIRMEINLDKVKCQTCSDYFAKKAYLNSFLRTKLEYHPNGNVSRFPLDHTLYSDHSRYIIERHSFRIPAQTYASQEYGFKFHLNSNKHDADYALHFHQSGLAKHLMLPRDNEGNGPEHRFNFSPEIRVKHVGYGWQTPVTIDEHGYARLGSPEGELYLAHFKNFRFSVQDNPWTYSGWCLDLGHLENEKLKKAYETLQAFGQTGDLQGSINWRDSCEIHNQQSQLSLRLADIGSSFETQSFNLQNFKGALSKWEKSGVQIYIQESLSVYENGHPHEIKIGGWHNLESISGEHMRFPPGSTIKVDRDGYVINTL